MKTGNGKLNCSLGRCRWNDGKVPTSWPTCAKPNRRNARLGMDSSIALGLGRQRGRARAGGIGRYAVFFLVASFLISSTNAGLFKRRGAKSRGSSSGTRSEGKQQVKENVAWMLEDKADGGWKPVSDDGHVKVWKREVPGSAFVAIKSSATLTASPQAIFEVLTPGDIEIVRQYNPLVEDGRDIQVLDRDNKISWSATIAIWPTRGRDFVTHIRRATLDDGSVAIVNSATRHVEAPITSKYVRGEILHGVFLIKSSRKRGHSEFTMMADTAGDAYSIVELLLDCFKVHHFNPGGSIPAWLVNWLAEGKPSTFVRRLEEVAMKWDHEAKRVKNMPCKGRGFGERPCAFLLPKREECADGEGIPPAAVGLRWGPMNMTDWLGMVVQMLAATGIVAAVGCFGWTVLVRHKTRRGGAVEACVGALVGSTNAKKVAENGNSTRGSNGDSAAAKSGSGSLANRESAVGVGPSGSTRVAPALNMRHETSGRASSQGSEATPASAVRRKEAERACECVSNGR